MKPFLDTTVVIQIGIVVRDIEQTAKDYAAFLGVPVPPIGITDAYEVSQASYHGKPTRSRAKQAFFDIGSCTQIELLEPDGEESTWREFLDTKGEGVHHIAFQIDGMEKMLQRCEDGGFPLVQKGDWETGSYAYVDTQDKLKVLTELLEFQR